MKIKLMKRKKKERTKMERKRKEVRSSGMAIPRRKTSKIGKTRQMYIDTTDRKEIVDREIDR